MNENSIIKLFFKSHLNDTFFLEDKYLLTTDTISEGTHFKLEWSSASDLAKKLVEVNISDIASSGAAKKGYALLNLGLNKQKISNLWINEFSKTLNKTLKLYNHQIIGGDTYFSKTINLNLSLISENEFSIERKDAKVGDNIYLTGSLGYSFLGYKILSKKLKIENKKILTKAIKKHLSPKSRFFEIKKILKNYKINSMMDITDGLIQDSAKMSLESKKDFYIDLDLLPELNLLNQFLNLDEILSSGEELELLCTSKDIIPELIKIGEVKKGNGRVNFFLKNQIYIPKKNGFIHF